MLLDKLAEYMPGRLPMHMPGHKRNTALDGYLKALRADLDITEIDGFDDLHAPEGALLDGMRRAARLWGADESRFLVNGTTCGLLAAVYALAANGGRAIVARNCHKSVYHALELTGVEPVFVMPDMDAQTGICCGISPDDVRRALDEAPDARFVLITSPTYEGVISDIAVISHIAHARNVPVIVDEAHGAHLGISECFPMDAMRMGADISVKSVHKTLPSLTQTAILLARHGRVDMAALDHALDVFETSSPSYLLMASIDGCVSLMERRGEEILTSWRQALDEFYEGAAALSCLRICRRDEPSKLVLDTTRSGISGFELARLLREENVEVEMASLRYAVAMTGAGDTRQTLREFLRALTAVDRALLRSSASFAPLPVLPRPVCVLLPKAALSALSEKVSAREAVGRVSAAYAWAHPPGVPMLIPGECVPEGFAELWDEWEAAGAKLVTTRGSLCVVREPESGR